MKDLVLLHGAIGASDQLKELATLLSDQYRVHTLDFSGHGAKSSDDITFSIPLFTSDVLKYLDQHSIRTAAIFGYSMGGYVAIYLARHHPVRVSGIVTLATKFNWNEGIAAKEVRMLDAETILAKVPAFADQLAKRHGEDNWRTVLDRTKDLLTGLGQKSELQPRDYSLLTIPGLLLLGDRDKMITVEETEAVQSAWQQAEMEILPATAHPIEQVDVVMLAEKIRGFVQ